MRKLHYNKRVDGVYVTVARGQAEESVKISDNVIIDVDTKGRIVGIEILNVSEVFPRRLGQKVLTAYAK